MSDKGARYAASEPQEGKPGNTVSRNLNAQGACETSVIWDGERDREGAPTKVGESDQGIVLSDMEEEGPDEVTEPAAATRTGQGWPGDPVTTALRAIADKAKRDRAHRFQNLYGRLSIWFLGACWRKLNKQSAVGVDRVSARDYERELTVQFKDLVERLKGDRYRAPYVLRRYIPKGPGKFRPLGIPATEDKLLQKAVAWILEAIYEPVFLPCSYGYRPKVGAKTAVEHLGRELASGKYRAIVEADISGFFENLDQVQLIEMVRKRVDDRRFVRLIQKWLHAGVLEPEGMVIHPLTGTPQGGIVSPILSNIYLHEALDEWFETVVKKHCRGEARLWRYADDFVCAFQYPDDAERFYRVLGLRLGRYGLRLAEDKTKIIRFDANDPDKSERFDFLGFEYGWMRDWRGRPQFQKRTSRKKMRKSLSAFKDWIKGRRSHPLRETMRVVNAKLRGYCNYYGVRGNTQSLKQYFEEVSMTLWKWLNRRSQRHSFTATEFAALLTRHGFPKPTIKINSPDPYAGVPIWFAC